MKLAVSGKGGVGKSTIAAMFCHLAATEGARVLAIDADPDANLAAALGMSASVRSAIVPLSEKRALIEERTGAKVKQYGQVFKLNPEVSDLVDRESDVFRGIHLMVLGAVESGASGCACPESVMLRALLADVVLYKDDLVIVDFEAGLEHLGRATARGFDLMLIIVEPGARAVETASKVRRMAQEIGVKRVAVVGNKIASEEDASFLQQAFDGNGYLGFLPYCETIRRADRESLPLIDIADEGLLAQFQALWKSARAYIAES